MIAAVKGCSAAAAALLLCVARHARAADDLSGAARELARKTAAFTGRNDPVSVTWRNLSSLGSAELGQARSTFEAALRDAGARLAETGAPAEARITLSENQSQYLMVEEARKGDEHQVWMAFWRRASAGIAGGVTLEKKLLWEQSEPILDAVPNGNDLLILSPGGILLRGERGTQTTAIPQLRPLPRDPRGHLRITAAGFKVNLPGVACNGSFAPTLSADCHAADEPWTLDAGSRGILLAEFASARDYFDGRIVTPVGTRKSLPAFYSAVAGEDQGRQIWLFATVDGRTLLFDGLLDPVGSVGPWGSDIVAAEARCAGGSQILATKPGDLREPDSIRAWSIVNRTAVAITAPVELSGPVTSFWSLGGASAVAVVRDPSSGHYMAYLITVVCSA